MRSIDSHYGLGFLLSLGALPIAGCTGSDDNDTNATTASVTNNTVGTMTAGDDTGSDPSSATGASAGDDTGSSPTDGGETGMASTTTDTDPTGLDETGGLPGECDGLAIPAACTDVMNKYIECYPRYARYYADFEAYCACGLSYYAPMYGAGCGTAQEDLYACIAMLSCEALMGETYCEAEQMAVETECFGGGTGTDDGGTTDPDGGGMTAASTDG
ncbi:MAG TPA: hypothetical protein VFG69_17060 [Nannocystaceae bacterium]|nr:hypothetical protein [Nannocystaceae bacterium]